MDVVMFLRQSWTDPRLKDDTRNNVTFKADEVLDKIWTPNLFHPNALEPSRIIDKGSVSISPAGDILYIQFKKESLSCPGASMGFASGQEAQQFRCDINVESFSYLTSDVIVTPRKGNDSAILGRPIKNVGLYQLISYNITQNEVKLPFGTYSFVAVSFYFESLLNRVPPSVLMRLLERGLQN